MESLKDLEPYVNQAIETFKFRMDEEQGGSVDLGKWVQLFAFGMLDIYVGTCLYFADLTS